MSLLVPGILGAPAADAGSLWRDVWEMRNARLWVLGAGLLVLTTVLVLQGFVFVAILISETFYGRFKVFDPARWRQA